MKRIFTMAMALLLIISVSVINVSAEENTVVYINGKLSSSISVKNVSGDVYICVEEFFEHFLKRYGAYVEYGEYDRIISSSAYIDFTFTEEYDEDRPRIDTEVYFYYNSYDDSWSFNCDEECLKYFDITLSECEYKYDSYKFELKKPLFEVDSEHHYAYYGDIKKILKFNLISAPEINSVAIYKDMKVPNNITVYDKKGSPVEINSLFKNEYIKAGYKTNFEDVIILPESKTITAEGIKVSLNGALLEFDVVPTIIKERTMVPLRKIFEALCSEVVWQKETQTVVSKRDNTTVCFTVGSDKMTVNGEVITVDSPATIIDGRMLVPIRALSEAFGLKVEWDEENSLVILRESKYEDVETTLLYNLSNQVVEVPDFEADSFKEKGWLTEKPIKMYAADGRTQLVAVEQVENNKKVGWYIEPVTLIYAPNGRTQTVAVGEVDKYIAAGWYDTPVVTICAEDGRAMVIEKEVLEDYKNVGWYYGKPIRIYSSNGTSKLIGENEKEDYFSQGWYNEPVTMMYATDGRTEYVKKSLVEKWQQVGWYTEPVYVMYSVSNGKCNQTNVVQSELEKYKKSGWRTDEPKKYIKEYRYVDCSICDGLGYTYEKEFIGASDYSKISGNRTYTGGAASFNLNPYKTVKEQCRSCSGSGHRKAPVYYYYY